jgi:hypothetical protein
MIVYKRENYAIEFESVAQLSEFLNIGKVQVSEKHRKPKTGKAKAIDWKTRFTEVQRLLAQDPAKTFAQAYVAVVGYYPDTWAKNQWKKYCYKNDINDNKIKRKPYKKQLHDPNAGYGQVLPNESV